MSTPNYVIEHMPPDALISHANALQTERKELTARIEELQRHNKMMVDAALRFRNAAWGEQRHHAMQDLQNTVDVTSADSAAWLEASHREWMKGLLVACNIIRNSAGQISQQGADGDYFDMSKYVGRSLYALPVKEIEEARRKT